MHHMKDLSRLRQNLYRMLAELDSAQAVESFLTDLCTESEIEYMAQRMESAKMLLEGATYQQVMAKVGISTATLSRVNRCVKNSSGGYAQYLPHLLETKEKKDKS